MHTEIAGEIENGWRKMQIETSTFRDTAIPSLRTSCLAQVQSDQKPKRLLRTFFFGEKRQIKCCDEWCHEHSR